MVAKEPKHLQADTEDSDQPVKRISVIAQLSRDTVFRIGLHDPQRRHRSSVQSDQSSLGDQVIL